MKPTRKLVHDYLAERRSTRTLTPGSIKGIRYTLNEFVDVMPSRPQQWGESDVLRWLERISRRCCPRSQRTHLSRVRTFCRWLIRRGHLRRSPAAEVPSPAVGQLSVRALDPADVPRLFAVCKDRRERLIITLLYEDALRIGEVAALKLEDIDRASRTMVVLGKGNKERTVPLTARLEAAMDAYLREFPASSGPLIRSYAHPSRGVGRDRLGQMVTDMMYAAGIKQRPHDGRSAHAIRHTTATDLVDAGADLRDVQEFLGHVHLTTTQHYTRRRRAVTLAPLLEARENG